MVIPVPSQAISARRLNHLVRGRLLRSKAISAEEKAGMSESLAAPHLDVRDLTPAAGMRKLAGFGKGAGSRRDRRCALPRLRFSRRRPPAFPSDLRLSRKYEVTVFPAPARPPHPRRFVAARWRVPVRSTLDCGGSTPLWNRPLRKILFPSGVFVEGRESGARPPQSKVLRTAFPRRVTGTSDSRLLGSKAVSPSYLTGDSFFAALLGFV